MGLRSVGLGVQNLTWRRKYVFFFSSFYSGYDSLVTAALLCFIAQLHHFPSRALVNGAPYIGFSCCSSLAGWKGAVWGRPNGRVFKVGRFSGLSKTRRHNDRSSVWEPPFCHSKEVAESGESASLHSAWGEKWDSFTAPRSAGRVSEMELTNAAVFLKTSWKFRGVWMALWKVKRALFRYLLLLFIKCV